ncbi:hypothetical protein RF11_08117 [Thelohanellus kitauei]|uniref:BRCT domain-containing protein n=1 Tax=Thelohanellus kitauei TaxID=669202 RepID=A0A0C2MHX7_THEKT|nr:hypothetical protein RF11_08117 [Thelohanellus kitauei]
MKNSKNTSMTRLVVKSETIDLIGKKSNLVQPLEKIYIVGQSIQENMTLFEELKKYKHKHPRTKVVMFEDDSIYTILSRGKLIFTSQDTKMRDYIIYIIHDNEKLRKYINENGFRVLTIRSAIYCLSNVDDFSTLPYYIQHPYLVNYIIYFSIYVYKDIVERARYVIEKFGAVVVTYPIKTITHFIVNQLDDQEYKEVVMNKILVLDVEWATKLCENYYFK